MKHIKHIWRLIKREEIMKTIDLKQPTNTKTPNVQNSKLLTVGEAAAFLRLKESTIRDWVLRRKITFVKLGGRVFIRKADAEALIERSLVPAIQPTATDDITITQEVERGSSLVEVKIHASE